MKRFYKLFACWVSVLLLVFSSGMQSLASFESLLISTDSNALMTMELDDSDYSTSLMSTLGTVTNTVSGQVVVTYKYRNIETGVDYVQDRDATLTGNRYHFYNNGPDGYYLYQVVFRLYNTALPKSGVYSFSMDYTSDFGVDYNHSGLNCVIDSNNVQQVLQTFNLNSYVETFSGDIYLSPIVVNLGNISRFDLYFNIADQSVNDFGGSLALHFEVSNGEPVFNLGSQITSSDYQNDVSSSLSDISSSVESVEEEISLVTQAIQTLQGAMEPHYDNVLTQLHHITEQLHAFYDQVYNNIHLPELDMLTQIRTAIENIDLQIEVDISEVKTAINNMSTAVQNKLQSTTDQITGGFDNSQQTQQNQQLQDSINAYDEVEEDIFEDVDGFMQEFEYPSFDSMNGSVIKALAFIGGFLQSIFLSMGDFGLIITFSLTMIFVMIIVGYHRIRS